MITVHGSGHRASRSWPRKTDGGFNIAAVTDCLLALVDEELSRPRPALTLPGGISAAASGLHVVHLAGVQLGVSDADSKAAYVLGRVEDDGIRQRIAAHLIERGLTDADMRGLADAAGLFLGRANRIGDHDPLEPINDRILTILRVGSRAGPGVARRHVVILDHRGDEIDLADPAQRGVTTVTAMELRTAWMLGSGRGKPWVATVFAR